MNSNSYVLACKYVLKWETETIPAYSKGFSINDPYLWASCCTFEAFLKQQDFVAVSSNQFFGGLPFNMAFIFFQWTLATFLPLRKIDSAGSVPQQPQSSRALCLVDIINQKPGRHMQRSRRHGFSNDIKHILKINDDLYSWSILNQKPSKKVFTVGSRGLRAGQAQ